MTSYCKTTALVLQRHCKPVAVALQSSCSITANRYAVTLQTVCSGTAKSMHSLCSEKSLLFTLLQYEYNEALSPFSARCLQIAEEGYEYRYTHIN